jgi:predicted NBD/HSP70 family sugar kinase
LILCFSDVKRQIHLAFAEVHTYGARVTTDHPVIAVDLPGRRPAGSLEGAQRPLDPINPRGATDIDAGTAGLLALYRTVGPLTRSEVSERTGWARMTVNTRLDRLVELGLLTPHGQTTASRGRPATRFRFHTGRGALLVADIGASAMRLALCDLGGNVRRRVDAVVDIADGPDLVLGEVERHFDRMLEEEGAADAVWGVGVSVPGPVEYATGTVVDPPIMTGWNGTRVPDRLGPRFDAPVVVEKDVNAMARGEQVTCYPEVADLLFVKIGTGVGTGVIAHGAVLRGAQGAAGDIGHTWADAEDARPRLLCRCGKQGCVESYASGWAIVRDLAAAGHPVSSVDQVVELVLHGDPVATSLVRDAGLVIGASLAHVVSLLNPSVIVVGGQLAAADEHLLAGIRERIYARSLPLATRNLRIARSQLDGDAGVLGLAHGLADTVLSPPVLTGRAAS